MERADVLILGGGLVGLTLAIALDAHGLTSIVIDPADPAVTLGAGFDGRASAVASASWRMLEAIGVADRLAEQGCAIKAISVSDGLVGTALQFEPDADDGPLGRMFENWALRTALREAAQAAPGVTLHQPMRAVAIEKDAHGVQATLDDGRVVAAALLVGAEGRRSPTREAAGIAVAHWRYSHEAIIGTLRHARPHDHVAHEIFYPAGPFALLPLNDDAEGAHRSAIVWTVAERDGAAMQGLSDRAFAHEAEARMQGLLGAIEVASPRTRYPLGFHHAARITAPRTVLVGDAAHGIHPIAGQGLNLGFRDVAALVEVLAEGARLGLDLGDAQLTARYERWRSLDTFLIATATDGLARLFGIPGRVPAAIRRAGLAAVGRVPMLKARFMAEARGESGALPVLLRGELV